MNGTDTNTSITATATQEALDTFQYIMERGAELRKKHQMTLPAIHVELSEEYDGGWAHTQTNSYYFDHSTDMVEFIKTILNDTEEAL